MDIKKLKRRETSSVQISIRIKPSLSKWLKDKNFSPTAVLVEACKELGYKEE